MPKTMPGKKSTRNEAVLAEELAAGAQKHLLGVTQLLLDGSTFTTPQVIAQLAMLADLRAAVDAANAIAKGKLAEERSKGPSLVTFLHAFESFVRTAFGGKPEILADFGLAPKKVKTPLTVEQQAAAKAKRAATRKARGTIGKKKKLAIKGNVTGIIVTPVTEPPPVAVVTPAPASALNGAAR